MDIRIIAEILKRQSEPVSTNKNVDPSTTNRFIAPDRQIEDVLCPDCQQHTLVHRGRMLLTHASGCVICLNDGCDFRRSFFNYIGERLFAVEKLESPPHLKTYE